MIYSRITSGLGNQMFQYAMAYSYAKKNEMPLAIDLTNFQISKTRNYELNKFDLDKYEKITFKNAPIEIKLFWIFDLINMFLSKLLRKRIINKHNYTLKSVQIIREKQKKKYEVCFNENASSFYFSGFWQSPLYFNEYRDEIVKQFVPCYNLSVQIKNYESKITNCESVSVHIRRGDFLDHGLFKSSDYQKRAIKFFEKKLDNPIFFFFSDDLDWVKNEFKNQKNAFFVSSDSENSAIDDIYLMSKCKNNIIANSTFSWWGAWLNQDQNKIVVAPHTGFSNNDIIPKEWYIM